MNEKTAGAAAAAWWRGLQPAFPDGSRNPNADRAALASLRRAGLAAAMAEPATFALFRALGRTTPDDLPAVALCAAVLAGVREDHPRLHPARALGAAPGEKPEAAAMKPLRFRRLIEAGPPEERLILLRRAVQLADRKMDVRRLAAACLDWSDETRRRWIFEYHNAGAAAPEPEPARAEEPAA